MNSLSRWLLLSLLLVALYSQSAPAGSLSLYNQQNGTYVYIYGSGQQGDDSLGVRDSSTTSAGPQTTAYVPPATPTPVQINCPYNQVYDNILCQCVCLIGFHFEGSACVANANPTAVCGKNEVYQDGRCVCAQGFFLIGSNCDVCPPYSAYNLPSLSCKCIPGYVLLNGACALPYNPPTPAPQPTPPTCSLNQRLSNNICVCNDGYYVIKGACTYCAAPNYYDSQLALCRPPCGLNQVLDINSLTCICQSGFYNVNGQCGGCPAYSVYNTQRKSCECVQGYTLNNGNCIIDTHAPTPVQPLPVPASQCGANMIFVNQQCICNKGFYLIGGICQTCPSGNYYDATLHICRIPCLANQVYNQVNKTCNCATSYYIIKGVCTQCPGNTTFDAKSGACGCPSGYRNQGGFCVVGCGVNQVLSNGQCCCITGYYPVNGICGQCDWNQVYDEGLGICRIPCDAKRIYDITSQSCVCLPQYFPLADGSCSTCPLHSTYSSVTQQCVCDQGYILNLGLCIAACNPYEQWVNGVCQCKSGYYLIGYSCGVCPPTQIYDSTYRICRTGCKTNEIWDPTIRACRCLPGYYLVGGICSQCDSRTQVYNQKLQCCDCIDGYHKVSGQGCNGVCSPICNVNEDWISGRCVCKPGFYLINNFCTQCPTGQIYDIYQRVCRVQCGTNQVYNFNSGKCDCAQGYYIVQGACSKCLYGETYDPYTQTCSVVPCQGVNEFYSDITQQCVCKSQYVRIRGVCTNCPPGYYYDSYSDQCLCKPGFKEVGGFCKPICPSDQTYINGECHCNNGAALYNGKCITPNLCPLNSHLDVKTQCCVCNDGFSVIDGKCSSYQYCGVNGYLKYGQCYCNNGYFWILGSCQPCGTNQAYNGVVCECYVGYTRDVNGNCVKSNFAPNCYKNERYDSTLQACVCVSGTVFLRGSCQAIPTCPQNAYFDGLQCVCNSGFLLQDGKCTTVNVVIPTCPANAYFNGVSCTCNSGFYQSALDACAPCAAGTSWDGIQCASDSACASGYFLNSASGQCEPSAPSCGANAAFNGATCCCSAGYSLINGKCQQCPTGSTFDGSQCSSQVIAPVTCGSNQIYVSGACVCSAGFYSIGGQCLSCPANTKWNGKYCACSNSDASKWCFGKPYSTFSNGACSCQSGYISVNGLCSSASN